MTSHAPMGHSRTCVNIQSGMACADTLFPLSTQQRDPASQFVALHFSGVAV